MGRDAACPDSALEGVEGSLRRGGEFARACALDPFKACTVFAEGKRAFKPASERGLCAPAKLNALATPLTSSSYRLAS